MFDDQLKKYVNRGYISLDKNFPPVAGTIMWINKLRGRISPQIDSFKKFENP